MADTAFDVRGVNHLALVCSDMAKTVEFYTEVLGLPLTKTIELPDGMGQHFFFDIGNGDSLAFFWFPGAPAREPGVTAPAALPGLGDITTAVSTMNHLLSM
jgi:catechol 2,3-dioxygenase-like lactoylglutathione lyase family enzyme